MKMTQNLTLEDGRQISIEWKRIRDSRKIDDETANRVNMFEVKETLKCMIYGIPKTCPGFAYMSRKEPVYNVARARRRSIMLALRHVSKPDRTLVWQAYNTANPPAKEICQFRAACRADHARRRWLDTLTKGQVL